MGNHVFDPGNYDVGLFSLPTFVVTTAIFSLGIVVLYRERISFVSVSFFLVTLTFAIWFFCLSWMLAATNASVAYFWARTGYLGVPFIPAAVFQFCVAILQVRQRHQMLMRIGWVIAAFFVILDLNTGSLIAGVYQYQWGFYPKYGWLGVPFQCFFLVMLLVSMRFYVAEQKKARAGRQKERIQAFKIAWVVAYAGALDILPKFGVPLYPFGYVPVFVFLIISARTIWRYRLVDITPQLAVSEIFDTMGEALFVLDVEGVIRLVNRAACEFFSLPKEKLIGMRVDHLCNGSMSFEKLQTVMKNGRLLNEEIGYNSPQGRVQTLSLSASVMRDRNDQAIAIVCLARDVTDRRELIRKFQESQERYQDIVEGSLDGIVIIQNGRLVFVNSAAAKIFGYATTAEMQEVSFIDTVAPASRPFVMPDSQNRTMGQDILRNFEMKGLRKSGEVIDLEISAKLIPWNGRHAVQTSFRDITERKKLEREHATWFWEQETMNAIDRHLMSIVDLQSVLDILSHHAKELVRSDIAGVVTVDRDRAMTRWFSLKGGRGDFPRDFLPINDAAKKFYDESEAVIAEDFGRNDAYPASDFPVLAREGVVSAIQFPLRKGVIHFGHLVVGFRKHRVISERMLRLLTSLADRATMAIMNAELYDQLRQHEKELEVLSVARVKAQEEERRRIAREIHDSLGQMLTAAKFNIEILEDEIASPDHPLPPRLGEIKSLLDEVMAEARGISYDLMPSVLEDFGLGPALELLCNQFAKMNNLRVDFQAHGLTERLDPLVEVGLYRISQEALNNVAKHACAKNVDVQIIRHGNGVRLIIADDGKGFAHRELPVSPEKRRGMGLVSMRERAASFNGTLHLESSPSRGTEIIVEIPNLRINGHEQNQDSHR